MGWKDPFGSSQWTVRQKTYVEAFRLDTIFTPHLVVHGRAQCVANDRDAVFTAINSVSRFPPLSFRATFERPRAETLQVSLTRSIKKDENGGNDIVIMVALFECGLLTRCEDGQNRDTVLANDYVVRRLERLCDGEIKDVVAETGKKKTVSSRTINFSLWETFNSCKCGIAIFIQNSSHQILGSQKFQLPPHI
ncbi:unnamed protein product [Cuscuta epithymum]|uniref:Uncharacterized protein n=1 Tax=Cuscuta epithymum TaxID=186058 RepID=A0AAV0CXH1_9ASTE|nr:unnamed protein product [Cuscuta epithymum]